ncbi:hypothetical protein QL285_020000 [Trifolium repens]|nr:hypothetical protein QL285_020000 [Trifolium repens]
MLLNCSLLEAFIDVTYCHQPEYGRTMCTIFRKIGRRNAKDDEALEKFESVLGTKPELDKAAVISYSKRVLREAGFTEQRIPPTPNSGGITGHCTSSPQYLVSLAP